jgi:hypothetical protein
MRVLRILRRSSAHRLGVVGQLIAARDKGLVERSSLGMPRLPGNGSASAGQR